MKFFEDIQVGERIAIGRHTFSAAEIKAFAARFDPQPFHLDEAAAERSHFGALVASGWHSAVVWMRLMVDQRRRLGEAARAGGVMVVAATWQIRVYTKLQAIVRERNQPQIAAVIGREGISFDVGQHVGDVIHHLALAVAGARPPPGDAPLPDGISGDGAFEWCFECKW